MKKIFIINLAYVILLNLVFLFISELKFSLLHMLFMIFILGAFTRLMFCFKYRTRIVLNSLFVVIMFIAVVANSLNMYIKGIVLSISQLTLFKELMEVKDTVLEYFNTYVLLVLLIPALFIALGVKYLKGDRVPLVKKEVVVIVSSFVVLNVVSYTLDTLLFSTIYSPNEYVEKYGLTSYYARDLLPFTKRELTEEIDTNVVTQEKYDQSDFYGMYEGKKNVVFIKAESLAYPAIDETLTPTLSKMIKNGMTFENYNTLTYNTNASEFSTLTSTPPPIDNSKVGNYKGNFDSIPMLFEEQGYCTFGTHSFRSTFYNRDELYPNTYQFQNSYFYNDLEVNSIDTWMKDEDMFYAASELIEQQGCEKNFTYYMSAYGHSKYEKVHRPGAMEGYAKVKKLYSEYDEYHQMYMSVQMSMDQMLSDMESYYAARGELDDTVFIVVSDHYPYALGQVEHKYGEYSKTYVETNFDGTPFETYNVPFFIYDPTSIQENRTEYMSNINVLPTVGDLFNLDYQYAYGTSPFRQNHINRVEWLAQEKFGILGEGILYTKENGIVEGDKVEVELIVRQSRSKAARLYSLFE